MNESLLGGSFSRETVLAATGVLAACLTQAETTRFLQELGPQVKKVVRDESASVLKRLNDLVDAYDDGVRSASGESIGRAIVVEALECRSESLCRGTRPSTSFVGLEDALARDGYEIADGRLQPALPTDVNLPGVRSELENLLDIHGFETAKDHLEQAIDAHARGQWAAANGQIRTFFEALLKGITGELGGTSDEPPSSKRLLSKLGQHGILKEELNEWGGNRGGFVDGLWRRLHPEGPHPGRSDKEDSTFRLHVTFLTTALLLKRFHRQVQNSTQ